MLLTQLSTIYLTLSVTDMKINLLHNTKSSSELVRMVGRIAQEVCIDHGISPEYANTIISDHLDLVCTHLHTEYGVSARKFVIGKIAFGVELDESLALTAFLMKQKPQ